jgi:phage replication O-like protein O
MAIRTEEFYKRQNRVMEKLAKTHLSPNESKYCWALFRKTFGYGEYKEFIKRGLMTFLTGLSRSRVSYIKKRLKERNIIFENSSVMGFNLNTDQWEMLQVSGTFKMLQVSGTNVTDRGYKNVTGIGTLLRTNKENSKKGGGVLKKLSYKETDKLEGKKWLKQVMWQSGNFREDFIDKKREYVVIKMIR